MIVLDTNVISEAMRSTPNPSVAEWLQAQSRAGVFSTTVTQAEILYGVYLLPDSKRRNSLMAMAMKVFESRFAGRILSFDTDAAVAYPRIAADRRLSGRPISLPDAQIAAITLSRGATLATRNVRDFEGCGIDIINPWQD